MNDPVSFTAPLDRWQAALAFLENLRTTSPARPLVVQPRTDGLWLSTQLPTDRRNDVAACRFDATLDHPATGVDACAFISLPHAAGLAAAHGLPPGATVKAVIHNDHSLDMTIHADGVELTFSFPSREPADACLPAPVDTAPPAPIVDPAALQQALQAVHQARNNSNTYAKTFGFRLERLNGRTLLITACNYWLLPVAIDAVPPMAAGEDGVNLPYACLNAFDAVFAQDVPTHWQITATAPGKAPTLRLETAGATWVFRNDSRETDFPDWRAAIGNLLPDDVRTTRITVSRQKLTSSLGAFHSPQAGTDVTLIENNGKLTITWSPPPENNLPDVRCQAVGRLSACVDRPDGADVADWHVNGTYLQTLLNHINGDDVTLFMPCEGSRPELPIRLQDSSACSPTAYLMVRRRPHNGRPDPVVPRRQPVVGRHYGLENAIDARLRGRQQAHEFVHVMTVREFCGCRVRLRTHGNTYGRTPNPDLSSKAVVRACANDGPYPCIVKRRRDAAA